MPLTLGHASVVETKNFIVPVGLVPAPSLAVSDTEDPCAMVVCESKVSNVGVLAACSAAEMMVTPDVVEVTETGSLSLQLALAPSVPRAHVNSISTTMESPTD